MILDVMILAVLRCWHTVSMVMIPDKIPLPMLKPMCPSFLMRVQVSAGTAAFLIVGRFAFLPFQRKTQGVSQSVGPKTTGE